jgi:hypothetical protein
MNCKADCKKIKNTSKGDDTFFILELLAEKQAANLRAMYRYILNLKAMEEKIF